MRLKKGDRSRFWVKIDKMVTVRHTLPAILSAHVERKSEPVSIQEPAAKSIGERMRLRTLLLAALFLPTLVAAQQNRPAPSATANEVRSNEPTERYISLLESRGLVDYAFEKKLLADFALPGAASTALLPNCFVTPCTGSLVCCDCIGTPRCTTVSACKQQCSL